MSKDRSWGYWAESQSHLHQETYNLMRKTKEQEWNLWALQQRVMIICIVCHWVSKEGFCLSEPEPKWRGHRKKGFLRNGTMSTEFLKCIGVNSVSHGMGIPSKANTFKGLEPAGEFDVIMEPVDTWKRLNRYIFLFQWEIQKWHKTLAIMRPAISWWTKNNFLIFLFQVFFFPF